MSAPAQQIPNGSFTYWPSPYTPNGWGTWASAVSSFNSASAISLSQLAILDSLAFDYPTDSAALRLTVDTVTLPSQGQVTLSGFASLGGASYHSPPLGQGLQFGYLRYSSLPDTLFFDYMYTTPLAADTAAIIMSLTRFDSASNSQLTYLSQTWLLGPSPQWSRNVALPLTGLYNNIAGYPDSLQLIFYASVSRAPQQGTTLWLDSLHFDASVNPVTGIGDIKNTEAGIYSYPNPATNSFNLMIPDREKGCTLEVYNMMGQKVYSATLQNTNNPISTSNLPDGNYSILIASLDRLTRFRGSVIVCR